MINHEIEGCSPGLFDQLNHPFVVGRGIVASLFLDVSSTAPPRWALVGEDELGVVQRVEIPRSWAFELLVCDARCRDSAPAATPELVAHLLTEAEQR